MLIWLFEQMNQHHIKSHCVSIQYNLTDNKGNRSEDIVSYCKENEAIVKQQ